MAKGAEGVILRKRKRKGFSKRPPDGPFGPNAAWIHGGCGTPEYSAYNAAKTLCANPKNPRWAQYGGRGIEFRFPSFAVFMEHLGRRPTGKILGRIRSDGHFEIGNVRWTTRRKNAKNRKVHRTARATMCGHPKHHAKGLCRACYEATPKVRARKAAYYSAHYVPRPRKISVRINSCGHPDRRHYAKGKCWPCYKAGLRAEGRLFQKVKATCHPDRPHMAKGLCATCYAATPERRAWQNAYAAARYLPKPHRG